MWENYPMLKDIKLNAFHAEENAKEMVFIQPLSTGYSAIYLKTIINQGRLYVRPQMNLMKEDVVYLENDNMYKVKEAFDIFWYFPTYLKVSPKENVLQAPKNKGCVKLMSRKSNFKETLDSIVNKHFFCDQ